MKTYTEFNLATLPRMVKFAELNISECWLMNFSYKQNFANVISKIAKFKSRCKISSYRVHVLECGYDVVGMRDNGEIWHSAYLSSHTLRNLLRSWLSCSPAMQTSSPMTISMITLCVSSRKLHRNSNLNPALRYAIHNGAWKSRQLYITLTEGSMRTVNFDPINVLTLLEYGLKYGIA